MNHLAAGTFLSVVVLVLSHGMAFAQSKPKVDLGKREFEASCASCHGINGKGGGSLVELLKRSPPDLTVLAKNNQGIFPVNRLYEVIDGTSADVKGHGARDMPVWGRVYRLQDAEYYAESNYDPEALVRARILALLEYINRLQVR